MLRGHGSGRCWRRALRVRAGAQQHGQAERRRRRHHAVLALLPLERRQAAVLDALPRHVRRRHLTGVDARHVAVRRRHSLVVAHQVRVVPRRLGRVPLKTAVAHALQLLLTA